MGLISFIFSTKFLLTILLLTAIPIGIIISLERAPHLTHVYQYHSNSWFRECAKWDDLNRRFLVSYMEGGVGEIKVPDRDNDEIILDEITAVKDVDLAGNASLGMTVDGRRNRVLVVVADLIGNRYGGLAAYDLSSWNRLFLTHLTNPGDEKAFADDVAVDEEGNAYITDARGNKIWKVNVDGKLLSIIKSPLFTPKKWYKNLVGLNGIVYHPDGYLLVIHTFSGNLYKIDLNKGEEIKLVKIVKGSLMLGDGLELLSSTKLVVAGNPAGRLVESSNGWETASVVEKFSGNMHRLATAATIKDGKVYLSHMLGLGYPKRKHVIVEAKFSS
ncbi:Megakaryocyte-associated tyrosine-protein kinase [Bienertia sinuspersici]